MVETTSNTDSQKVSLILDAACKRFGYYGLAKTTMTEIATDVGLSKASLYYYFEDKETLFRAVVKREQDGFISEMKKLIESNDSAQNKLKKYGIQRHEYFMKVFRNLGQAKLSLETVKPLIQNLLDTFFKSEVELVSEIMKEGIKKSEFSKIDVPAHADMLIASMNGLRSITIKNKDTIMLEQSDYEEVERRTKNLIAVFIKGIIKK